MKKITLLAVVLLILPFFMNAQVHFTFDSSQDVMGDIVITAEGTNTQTFTLTEWSNANNTESSVMSSSIVTDSERGSVLELANRYEYAAASSLPTTGDWTMSYWFKLNEVTSYQSYKTVLRSPSECHVVDIINVSWNAGKSALYLNKISGLTNDQGDAFVPGEWVHLVFAFDESENEITSYRNGVFLETQNYGNTYPFAFQNYNAWVIGADFGNTPPSRYDDYMIHDGILDQAAVTSLYNSQAVLSVDDNVALESEISLYPNPAQNMFKIEVVGNLKISDVTVYNAIGQKKSLRASESNKNEYDVSDLASGLYMVKISDENGNITTKRLIKN
ncbi:T9SS type A sorting domain-containing protein [Polaribacter aestuariivivens]|uniref:T9SS type A sorting domain-containing protein n=1 Tax=Polaribacter aestuariivivens TaxID=2304626 RepID=UPI003F49617A